LASVGFKDAKLIYLHSLVYITMMMQAAVSSFPIPSSLQDLEREPYNLLPYPDDFDDTDEAARADSFQALVYMLEEGNRTLSSSFSSSSAGGGLDPSLFNDDPENSDNEGLWMKEERVQALYTLVR
jgi:condensin complex subunit 1